VYADCLVSSIIERGECFGQWRSSKGYQHFKGNASHVLYAYCLVWLTLVLKIVKIDLLILIEFFSQLKSCCESQWWSCSFTVGRLYCVWSCVCGRSFVLFCVTCFITKNMMEFYPNFSCMLWSATAEGRVYYKDSKKHSKRIHAPTSIWADIPLSHRPNEIRALERMAITTGPSRAIVCWSRLRVRLGLVTRFWFYVTSTYNSGSGARLSK
jgi:hypothetical protein